MWVHYETIYVISIQKGKYRKRFMKIMIQDLLIDLLTLMTLMREFENQYRVTFTEEQLSFSESTTVGELIDSLNQVTI